MLINTSPEPYFIDTATVLASDINLYPPSNLAVKLSGRVEETPPIESEIITLPKLPAVFRLYPIVVQKSASIIFVPPIKKAFAPDDICP